jgi:hypothetical protein
MPWRWPHCTVQDSTRFSEQSRDWRERRGCAADAQSDQQQLAVADLRIMSRESGPRTPMTPASSPRDLTVTAAQFNCEQGDS